MACTRELFARHGLRCTRQRMAVYEALCECGTHPTAEELFRFVKPRTSTLSLATVYNSLEALLDARLIRRLPTTNGCCRYDADTSPHPHVCLREDAQVVDVPAELGQRLIDCVPRDVIDAIGRHLGVEIEGVSIQLIAGHQIDGVDGASPGIRNVTGNGAANGKSDRPVSEPARAARNGSGTGAVVEPDPHAA